MTIGEATRAIREEQRAYGDHTSDGARFDRIEAMWWWFQAHHFGQWSAEYAAFCRLNRIFRCGDGQSGPPPEAAGLYEILCIAAGCDHE